MKKILLKDFACIKVIFYLSNIFIISICIIIFNIQNAYAIECPPPPQQFTNEISGNVKGELRGALQKLVGGSLEGKVDVIANNLFSQYPNADRLTLAVGIMSMYCQIINESTQWDDNRKLQAINEMNTQILRLINPPDASSNIPELDDKQYDASSRYGVGLTPLYSIFNKNGGEIFNLEREIQSTAYVHAGKCNGHHAYAYGLRHFCGSEWKGGPADFSKHGWELMEVPFYIDKFKRYLTLLDKALQKSGMCIENGVLSCPIRLTYDDVYGTKHERYFGIGVIISKEGFLNPNAEFKYIPPLSHEVISNKKEWDNHKEFTEYIEQTSNAWIFDENHLNEAAKEITSEKSSLKKFMGGIGG